jgi:hypothetical protein
LNKIEYNANTVVKVITAENGEPSNNFKYKSEVNILGIKCKPERIETYGRYYFDFEEFLEDNQEYYIDKSGYIPIVKLKPSVTVCCIGGWENEFEKYFDTVEEANKYAKQVKEKANPLWIEQ